MSFESFLEALPQLLISGVLIGLVYALIAVGLTIIFGVMDIVNFAHGEFLMFGSYSAVLLFTGWAVDPLYSMPLTMAGLFVVGVLTYKIVISRIIDAPMLSQIFATFGLMILFRAIAQYLWSPTFRSAENTLSSGSIAMAGVQFGKPSAIAGIGAVLVTAAVYFFLNKTKTGIALEATAADKEAARLMGIDSEKMFALAWGIGAACSGVAGALLATSYSVFPNFGETFILIAFVIVNLGGFGSVAGAFFAGLIVGLIEMISGFFFPQFKLAIVLLLFLGVLMFRPQGLMGKSVS